MDAPKYQVFICTNQRKADHPEGCCYDCRALDIYEAFKAEIHRQNLGGMVEISTSRCLDHCKSGVVALVYQPKGRVLSSPPNKLQRLFAGKGDYYGNIKVTDVVQIVESHFVKDEPLRRCQI